MTDAEQFSDTDRILSVDIEEGPGAVSADLEQERRVAIYDLIEESRFHLAEPDAAGPYRLRIGAEKDALRVAVAGESGDALGALSRPLGELAETVDDYVALCEDYRDAVRRLAPSQIEKIDEARREAHREGAEILAEALSPALRMDATTARRFFTVLCAARGAFEL